MFLLHKKILSSKNILFSWLKYKKYLIKRFESYINTNISFKILSHKWVVNGWWEQYVLKICSEQVLRREIIVYNYCNNNYKYFWYARSIFPHDTYKKNPNFFNRLEHEPLGNLLFESKVNIVRSKLIIYMINKHYIEYYWLVNNKLIFNNLLWTRLSSFLFMKKKFYLIEIFLPDFIKIIYENN